MSNSTESLTEDMSQKRGYSKVDSGYAAESSEVTIGSNGVPSSSAYDFSAADYERIARMAHQRYLYRFIKRAFDISFSLCAIVVFLVPVLLVCLAIYIDDPHGSPLFFQKRVGRHGHEFTMIKLRSMCVDAEERLAELKGSNEKTGPVFKMRDDPRITRVGKFIRKTSMAPVIIGTPGDGEPTKSLSHPENSSLDLQKCERRPGTSLGARHHYTSFQFLSFAVFGGPEGTSGRHLCAFARAPFAVVGTVA